MFHAFDNTGPNRPTPRPEWMALLSRAPLPLLEQALSAPAAAPLQWLRKPETGLYMVQGRAGGTGERFNLGEMTVTRCALRVGGEDSAVGVAYVMGRNHRQAQLARLQQPPPFFYGWRAHPQYRADERGRHSLQAPFWQEPQAQPD